MNQDNREREKNIYLRDMFFYVLNKWKLLLILVLIGAILGGAVSVMKMSENSLESQKKRIDALVKSQVSFENIDLEKVRQYNDSVTDYNNAVATEQNSNRLKIGTKVWVGTHTYFLTLSQENINLVNAYITGILSRDDNLQMLYDNSGTDWTYDEFATTVSISFKAYEAVTTVTGEINPVRNATVTVRAWAEDQDDAVDLLNQLNDLYNQSTYNLELMYPGSFSSERITATMRNSTVSTLTSLRDSLREKRVTAYNNMTKLGKNLSDNEMLYYNIYYNDDYNPSGAFPKKWLIAFAAVLLIAGIIFFCIRYLLDSSIKNENDIGQIYGFNTLAIMARVRKKTKGPAALIQRWDNKGKAPINNKEYLKMSLQTLDIRRGVVSGDVNDATISRLAATIAESDPRFIEAGSLSVDPEAQIKVKNADGVVFIVRLWYTKTYDFERDIEVARNLDSAVLGVIVIR